MSEILKPKETAIVEWFEIVKEAESSAGLTVDDELEVYLVNLLHRFMNKPELANAVLGLDYLVAEQDSADKGYRELRRVGDQCLLYSGLYPQRAERRRCPLSYWVALGQRSYISASFQAQNEAHLAELFEHLCSRFVRLMDILQSIRALSGSDQKLTLLQAVELWQETGSESAKKIIEENTQGFVVKR